MHRGSILLVDDEEKILKALGRALRRVDRLRKLTAFSICRRQSAKHNWSFTTRKSHRVFCKLDGSLAITNRGVRISRKHPREIIPRVPIVRINLQTHFPLGNRAARIAVLNQDHPKIIVRGNVEGVIL